MGLSLTLFRVMIVKLLVIRSWLYGHVGIKQYFEIIGLIIEVAILQRLIYAKEHVAGIERWPQFRGLE